MSGDRNEGLKTKEPGAYAEVSRGVWKRNILKAIKLLASAVAMLIGLDLILQPAVGIAAFLKLIGFSKAQTLLVAGASVEAGLLYGTLTVRDMRANDE